MSQCDWIRVYDDAVKPSTCLEWREALETSEHTRRLDEGYLNCRKLSLDLLHWSSICEQLADAFDRYKSDVPHNGNLHFCTHIEVPSVLKYEANGTDHFHLHADNWNAESALRQVSAIVFLNTIESGGAVDFPTLGKAIAPVEGRVLFFPAFYMFLHRAEPPISRAKYALVTWFCYPSTTHHYRVHPLR